MPIFYILYSMFYVQYSMFIILLYHILYAASWLVIRKSNSNIILLYIFRQGAGRSQRDSHSHTHLQHIGLPRNESFNICAKIISAFEHFRIKENHSNFAVVEICEIFSKILSLQPYPTPTCRQTAAGRGRGIYTVYTYICMYILYIYMNRGM